MSSTAAPSWRVLLCFTVTRKTVQYIRHDSHSEDYINTRVVPTTGRLRSQDCKHVSKTTCAGVDRVGRSGLVVNFSDWKGGTIEGVGVIEGVEDSAGAVKRVGCEFERSEV